MTILRTGFDTRAITMEPMWRITYSAPVDDIDRVFDAVRTITPLVHGKTDHTGYLMTGGFEYYRPREGTPTGAEEGLRKRPDVANMVFFLPRDEALLNDVIEVIYDKTSYYEPVIVLDEVLRGATKGLDDNDNPNRWWNTVGDWKKDG